MALCPVEVIDVNYEGKDCVALKMPRYITTLQDVLKFFEKTIDVRGRQLMQAVLYMYDHRIVHMDIKASNIFISHDKSWLLGDFGSSKNIGEKILDNKIMMAAIEYSSQFSCIRSEKETI